MQLINIKYYVFLLVGIFLAIGLGMMIGVTLENQNIIENQQSQLIRQIEDQFVSLRTEKAELQEGLRLLENQRDQLYELSSMLLTEVVQNKLSDIHIGVISFTREVPMGDMLDFLQLTGATVQSAVTFTNAVPGKELAALAGQSPDEMITAVINDLVFSMNYGGITPLIQEAEDLKLITNDGGYDVPIDTIILMGQGSSTLPYDKLMIESALRAGMRIVAVEAGDIQESAIAEYKAFGISTVDHAESIYGKLALASILSGYKGNFGFSNEAQDILPSPLFLEVADMEQPEQSISTNREEIQ
jgi:hypothetical protein